MNRLIQPRPKKNWCSCGTGEIYGDGFCKPCLVKHATKALETWRPMQVPIRTPMQELLYQQQLANSQQSYDPSFIDTGLAGDIRNL